MYVWYIAQYKMADKEKISQTAQKSMDNNIMFNCVSTTQL